MQIQLTSIGMQAPAAARPKDGAGSAGVSSLPADAMEAPAQVAVSELREAAAMINRELLMSGRQLSFSVDEASGKTVLKVLHSVTGEVVRQIPNETVLAVSERLRQGERLESLGLDSWA